MATFGIMADLHCHNWQAFSTVNKDGINSRLADILHEVDRCCEKVQELGGDTIFIAGDVFHTRGNVAPSVFNPLRQRLGWWGECGMRFFIIAGNHDLESKESVALNSAVAMLNGPNVYPIHRTQTVTSLTPWVRLVPWMSDQSLVPKEIEAALVGVPASRRQETYAFIHAGINTVLPGMPDKGIDAATLKALGLKGVFAGHYHNHKDLGDGIFSIGAPTHHTWGDVGMKAGFMVVHDDKPLWFASHAPSFIQIGSNLDEDELPLLVDGHFVKAELGSITQVEITEARRLLTEMGAKGVLINAAIKAPGIRIGSIKASLDSLDMAVSEWITSNSMSAEVESESLSILAEVRT